MHTGDPVLWINFIRRPRKHVCPWININIFKHTKTSDALKNLTIKLFGAYQKFRKKINVNRDKLIDNDCNKSSICSMEIMVSIIINTSI